MAVTITAAELAPILGVNDATATRVLAAASALVMRAAGPDTPQEILNEATVRCSGWLAHSKVFGVYESRRGEREFTNSGMPGGVSALRHSGALALLRPWRQLGIVVAE